MKKLFTLIALTSAIIPALHSMDTNLPTDVQKQYDNLTALIQNADFDAFKPAYDALRLPAATITALRQTIIETKATITNELDAMGDKTKSWSKIVKGSLATIGGIAIGLPTVFIDITEVRRLKAKYAIHKNLTSTEYKNSVLSPWYRLEKTFIQENILSSALITTASLAIFSATYKGLTYGIKTFKTGLNYKEHLQNMLTNLDAIDAHITHAKA